VKDLAKLLPKEGEAAADVALLTQEVQRCRTILGKLASLGNESGSLFDRMTLSHLVEEVVAPQRDFGVTIDISKSGDGVEPVCQRNPGILYGLGNLVENAIDFATSEVAIIIRWGSAQVRLIIEDDGPGFKPEVLARLGDPYISTRGPDRRAKSEEGGLGLGLFIAKTLLERSGANVAVSNRPSPETGARISVVWPRNLFEPNEDDVKTGDENEIVQAYIQRQAKG
jgi:two-component system sensor histidine kinase RegB